MIFFLEDLSAEQKQRVHQPQNEEYSAGDDGIHGGFSGKTEQEKQRRDHDHGGEVGKDVQTGGGRLQTGVDFLHQDHAVGGSAGQRERAAERAAQGGK